MNAKPTPRALGFRMPAEWEPHEATWIAWPHNASDWPGRFETIAPRFVELTRQLCRSESVHVIVRDDAERKRVEAELDVAKVDRSRVRFFESRTDRSWTRDSLPTFVASEGEIAAVKWRFDGWARYDDHELDEATGQRVAEWLGIRAWEPSVDREGLSTRVVLEGGAFDVDGEGTLIVSEACLFAEPHGRNRWLDESRVETLFSDYLGVSKVLWVGEGIVGDDTFGHVDDFVRFVGPGRVVLCQETNRADANHSALAACRERLEGARDAAGRALEIVPLPMPRPLVVDGERLPASYANFYIANERVLVPTFDDPADEMALSRLGEVFVDREIVPIRAVDWVLGLGTLHCSTQQQPRLT